MDTYKYNREKFPRESVEIIDFIINNTSDKELLDIITEINDKNVPVFLYSELSQVKQSIINKIPTEQIKLFTINKNGHSLYTYMQMSTMRKGIYEGLTQEGIEFCLKTNKKGNSVYDYEKMKLIISCFLSKYTVEDVLVFAKLNENMSPVFNSKQMKEIILGINFGLSKEQVSLYLTFFEVIKS